MSVFEKQGKIIKIKFGNLKKQRTSKILKEFNKKLLKFFKQKVSNINIPHKMTGSPLQKKYKAN